jgi:hypothetical protein
MRGAKPSLLFALLVWSLLILRFGYRYGTGDQVELLPYVLYLHDHSLFAHDFFIQGLSASVPNERTIMANLTLPFINHLEIFCFLMQLFSTVLLVMGLQQLAFRFIHNKYLAWLAILIAMIPLNDYTLGNVELYSECFQASGLAVAIIVWAINLFIDRKFIAASILMSGATFIQLLEGLDVMIVLSVIMLFMLVIKQIPWKTFVAFGTIYFCTAGVYLVMILMNKMGTVPGGFITISNAELFKIVFQFRHPHHFIFTSFPLFKMVVFFALTLCALIFYSGHSSKMFDFILIGLFGVIVYAFAVDAFHNVFIGNFQFYKVTIWMKFLGVVALVGMVEEFYLNKGHLPDMVKFEKIGIIALALVSWLVIIEFNQYLPYKVPFQLFSMKEKDDMIAICEKINETIPANAFFVQPFDNTELKFYGRRSSFVEFKANVKHKSFVGEWYRRIQIVYGISANDAQQGFKLQDKADASYYTSDPWQFNRKAGYGITHMLVKKDYKPLYGTLVLSNSTYAVYKL